jgi:hypothetical protein
MVAPSFAAKKAVSDEELDMVTAAGQPVIIQGEGTLSVDFTGTTDIVQTIQTGSQQNLRALALNNVLGENQVANGINISGGVGSGSLGQTNTLNQSWGATADISLATGKGGKGIITPDPICPSGTLICKVTTVTTAGQTQRIRASSAADQIIRAEDGDATVTYNPTLSASLTVDADAQNTLVALVVNNVVGLNQVGNGVNLAGSSTTVGPTVTIANTQAGPGPAGQTNVLGAWRGTPRDFTRLP